VFDNDLVEDIVFVSKDFLQGENLRSMIGRMTLMHCLFLESVPFGEEDFWCYLGGVSTAAKELIIVAQLLFFEIILLLLVVCIRNATGVLYYCRGWM
jgi:hypothetical protein